MSQVLFWNPMFFKISFYALFELPPYHGYPNDPRSYVVRGYMPLLRSPKANRSKVTGQTKIGSKTL